MEDCYDVTLRVLSRDSFTGVWTEVQTRDSFVPEEQLEPMKKYQVDRLVHHLLEKDLLFGHELTNIHYEKRKSNIFVAALDREKTSETRLVPE